MILKKIASLTSLLCLALQMQGQAHAGKSSMTFGITQATAENALGLGVEAGLRLKRHQLIASMHFGSGGNLGFSLRTLYFPWLQNQKLKPWLAPFAAWYNHKWMLVYPQATFGADILALGAFAGARYHLACGLFLDAGFGVGNSWAFGRDPNKTKVQLRGPTSLFALHYEIPLSRKEFTKPSTAMPAQRGILLDLGAYWQLRRYIPNATRIGANLTITMAIRQLLRPQLVIDFPYTPSQTEGYPHLGLGAEFRALNSAKFAWDQWVTYHIHWQNDPTSLGRQLEMGTAFEWEIFPQLGLRAGISGLSGPQGYFPEFSFGLRAYLFTNPPPGQGRPH